MLKMVNNKQELQNPSEYSLSNKCNSSKYGDGHWGSPPLPNIVYILIGPELSVTNQGQELGG